MVQKIPSVTIRITPEVFEAIKSILQAQFETTEDQTEKEKLTQKIKRVERKFNRTFNSKELKV